MLHAITAPLYSDLEEALAEHLQSFRSHSPFAPLTIVAPSEYVRLRLQWALCAERDLSLFHVHFLTFFQLALRLVEEQGSPMSCALRSESFFREWIHRLLHRRKAALPVLARLTDTPGGWAALWSTIKDLKDGSVDAVFAREALKHSLGGHDPVGPAVLTLYDWYRQEQQQFQLFDCDDIAGIACAGVAASPFLSQQGGVWYYGFYDLTQVQLDLFHAIAQSYPTTVYFPLVQDHPAYRFAQQFFDRHIVGLSAGKAQRIAGSSKRCPLRALFAIKGQDAHHRAVGASGQISDETVRPGGGAPPSAELAAGPLEKNPSTACHVFFASGAEDEISIVAKEILRHAEERQVPWREIGVVGRTLSGYEPILPRVFQEHGIPFNTTMQRSIAEFPYAQGLLRLLAIPVTDFQRGPVMDVLTSPCFRWRERRVADESPRPDLWDRESRRLGIAKGLDEWKRFIRTLEKECGKHEGRQKTLPPNVMSHDQIQACEETLRVLFEALQRFSTRASYEVFVEQTLTLLEEFLIPFARETGAGQDSLDAWNRSDPRDRSRSHDQLVYQAVRDRLAEVRMLAQISDDISFPEFVETVERFMREAAVPLRPSPDIVDGVWVLDAMAARGFSFRVLFVVGVNEQVFPRRIREDAFLRDSVRRFLDVNLGFKVPVKAEGYEEEQLLFYLLVNSARENVTLVAQRVDRHDRSVIPSWYVAEVQRCVGDLPVTVVPKRGSEKRRNLSQYGDTWLTPRETRVQWMLDRRLPRSPLTHETVGWSVIQGGVAALACHESSSPRLHRFDGVTGMVSGFWREARERGMSPTALEHYALCPFKFFGRHVLELERVVLPEAGSSLGPREAGNLLHQVLKDCVAALAGQHVFPRAGDAARDDIARIVTLVADRVFRNYERWNPVGYPLLWEWQQEQLAGVVRQVILQELCEGQDDWMPMGFEESVRGEMSVVLGNESCRLPLVGRIDRVDWSASRQQSRIVDYKYKNSARSIPTPQSLARDIVRGVQLQPPLYLLVADGGKFSFQKRAECERDDSSSCAGVWLYFITPHVSGSAGPLTRVPFTREMWQALRIQFRSTLNTIVEGIRRGEYFIVPGNHCQRCDYRIICRRTHSMSRWRALADRAQTKGHRDIQRIKPLMPSSSSRAKI